MESVEIQKWKSSRLHEAARGAAVERGKRRENFFCRIDSEFGSCPVNNDAK